MKDEKIDLRLKVLASQYAILSEIEECFVENSKHKAYDKIQKKMNDILKKMSELKNNKN
jgi:uncharacterized coiled-coil protein SlyX